MLWDLTTGKNTAPFPHGGGLYCVEFSPDGTILAFADGFAVRLWNLATGKQLRNHEKHKSIPIWDVAFSPDGKTLASASNREVILWDMER